MEVGSSGSSPEQMHETRCWSQNTPNFKCRGESSDVLQVQRRAALHPDHVAASMFARSRVPDRTGARGAGSRELAISAILHLKR